jgi:hypothetical protein
MTDIDPETVEYFDKMVKTIENLNTAKTTAVQYLQSNQIKDRVKIQNCIVISQVWAMDQMGKTMTLADLMIFLGTEFDVQENTTLELDPTLIGLDLNQVFDVVITKTGSIL